MNTLILLCGLVAVCAATPVFLDHRGLDHTTLYHDQDALGQYSFGFKTLDKSRSEVRGIDGAVAGTYSYFDPHGIMQTVNYKADHNGFRAAGTNIPTTDKLVAETPVMLGVGAKHLIGLDDAKLKIPIEGDSVVVEARTMDMPLIKAAYDPMPIIPKYADFTPLVKTIAEPMPIIPKFADYTPLVKTIDERMPIIPKLAEYTPLVKTVADPLMMPLGLPVVSYAKSVDVKPVIGSALAYEPLIHPIARYF